jgi:hypothetical protein
MQDFGTKANDTAGPSGQLSADEFNNLATELENFILRSGQGLSGVDVLQMAIAAFINGTKAGGFQDSGVANAYVATPISGSTGVALPANYTPLNGAEISFKASSANTGASTLNIGQTTGTLLGAKAIVDQSGAVLTTGAIAAGTWIQVRYDSSIGAGSWVLMPASVNKGKLLNIQNFTISGTYIPSAMVSRIMVIVIGAGGGGGGVGSSGAGFFAVNGGGGGGGVAQALITAGFSSVAVTVGTGGSSGASGGASSFGSYLSANGGTARGTASSANTAHVESGAIGGSATVNTSSTVIFISTGQGGKGGDGISFSTTNFVSGSGGQSYFGAGGMSLIASTGNGINSSTFGGGGGSAASSNGDGGFSGGTGNGGIVSVWEYS